MFRNYATWNWPQVTSLTEPFWKIRGKIQLNEGNSRAMLFCIRENSVESTKHSCEVNIYYTPIHIEMRIVSRKVHYKIHHQHFFCPVKWPTNSSVATCGRPLYGVTPQKWTVSSIAKLLLAYNVCSTFIKYLKTWVFLNLWEIRRKQHDDDIRNLNRDNDWEGTTAIVYDCYDAAHFSNTDI